MSCQNKLKCDELSWLNVRSKSKSFVFDAVILTLSFVERESLNAVINDWLIISLKCSSGLSVSCFSYSSKDSKYESIACCPKPIFLVLFHKTCANLAERTGCLVPDIAGTVGALCRFRVRRRTSQCSGIHVPDHPCRHRRTSTQDRRLGDRS